MQFVFHIGPSRTATTTLQAHLFPTAESNLILTKPPRAPSLGIWSAPGSVSFDELTSLFCEYGQEPQQEPSAIAVNILFPIAQILMKRDDERLRHLLGTALRLLASRYSSFRAIYISSEILSETDASLDCCSSTALRGFPVYALCRTMQDALGLMPLVSLCLRDPLSHLVSKYVRCVEQRRRKRLRPLSPGEYVAKQVHLDRRQGSVSALAPLIHTRFLRELQSVAFVKAYGFRQLLESEDVFPLLGLLGERKIAFASLPRENAGAPPLTGSELSQEVSAALKQHGYYEVLMQARMDG